MRTATLGGRLELLMMIRDFPESTLEDLSAIVGWDVHTVKRYRDMLIDEKIISLEPRPGKRRIYRIDETNFLRTDMRWYSVRKLMEAMSLEEPRK